MPPNQQYPQYPVQPGLPPVNPMMPSQPPKKHKPWILIIMLVLFIMLTIGAAGVAMWAYAGREDYKNNVDQKVDAAVKIAVQNESSRKDKEFVEREKEPLKKYKGPSAFGTLDISYPKTWSAFVTENEKASVPIEGYFHPNFVPGVQSGTAFALRISVTSQTYDQEMKQFDSKVKAGKVKVSPFSAKNVAGVTGARVDGEINTDQQGSMVLLPLRDRTIKISTQSQQFMNDFNTIILEYFKFVP